MIKYKGALSGAPSPTIPPMMTKLEKEAPPALQSIADAEDLDDDRDAEGVDGPAKNKDGTPRRYKRRSAKREEHEKGPEENTLPLVSGIKYKGGERFKEGLTSSQLAALNSHLMSDVSIRKIIRMLKDEWKVFQDSSDETLRRQLYRYKDHVILPHQAKTAAKFADKTTPEFNNLMLVLNEANQRLDPVRALEQVVVQQMSRVTKLHKVEEKLPSLMDAQTKNMGLLANMLKDLAALQMDIGLLTRVPKRLGIGTFEVTEEEREFEAMRKAHDKEAGALRDAMAYLAEQGLVVNEDGQMVTGPEVAQRED